MFEIRPGWFPRPFHEQLLDWAKNPENPSKFVNSFWSCCNNTIMPALNKVEIKLLNKLYTPQKIQDFLENMPINFEKQGETCYSPRLVLRHDRAHCLEAAIFAAA